MWAADVLAWLTGVVLVVCLLVGVAGMVYGTAAVARHRWHVATTARRLRRQAG